MLSRRRKLQRQEQMGKEQNESGSKADGKVGFGGDREVHVRSSFLARVRAAPEEPVGRVFSVRLCKAEELSFLVN